MAEMQVIVFANPQAHWQQKNKESNWQQKNKESINLKKHKHEHEKSKETKGFPTLIYGRDASYSIRKPARLLAAEESL
jgi:hypothetical protein